MTRGRLRERLDTEACACAAHRLVDTEDIIATPWQFPDVGAEKQTRRLMPSLTSPFRHAQ